jgi:hypothetical protein
MKTNNYTLDLLPNPVIPAKAGIQKNRDNPLRLVPRLRGGDGYVTSLFTLFLLLFFTVGCGSGHVSVTGKVTLTDGTVVDKGEVIFTSASTQARGYIQKDGTYSLTSGDVNGIPPGSYQVSIGGFNPSMEVPKGPDGMPAGSPRMMMPIIPFADKYRSGDTSGLTCEVKGRKKYNIELEPAGN